MQIMEIQLQCKESSVLACTKSKANLDKIADISWENEVTHVGIPLCTRGDMPSDAAITRVSKGRRIFMTMCVDLEVILNSIRWQYILNSTGPCV